MALRLPEKRLTFTSARDAGIVVLVKLSATRLNLIALHAAPEAFNAAVISQSWYGLLRTIKAMSQEGGGSSSLVGASPLPSQIRFRC